MKPLASPVTEYRVMGLAQLVGGVCLAVLAVTLAQLLSEAPVQALWFLVLMILFAASFFGSLTYLFGYRRLVRRVIAAATEAKTDEREPVSATRRRAVLICLALVLVMSVLMLLMGNLHLPSGFTLGNGAAFLVMSHRMQRWEQQHNKRLLREPRYRLRGERWWKLGGGHVDPRDFYFEYSTNTTNTAEAPRGV